MAEYTAASISCTDAGACDQTCWSTLHLFIPASYPCHVDAMRRTMVAGGQGSATRLRDSAMSMVNSELLI